MNATRFFRNLAASPLEGSAARPESYSPHFLRFALGMVYFYFGFLKFFPDLSPAELIATQTVMRISQHWLDASTALWWLAVAECAIGLGFLFNKFMRTVFALFMLHMAGTFLPLLLLPELTYKIAPFAPTTEGQYIMKNIVFVAAGWTVFLPYVWPAGTGEAIRGRWTAWLRKRTAESTAVTGRPVAASGHTASAISSIDIQDNP